MSKQYGLIIPGKQKSSASSRELLTKPSIFQESSSSDDEDNARPQIKVKKAPLGSSTMERRMARDLQEKALAEDPTIFQYDELYDEMETKRTIEQKSVNKEQQKPKYITRLMETAERRKLENELRVERQVQKEREAEGDQFKDKESFVTSSYRKKLEEMRKLEQQNKRDNYLETIGDVTKQENLDGFYRYLYEQKLGSEKDDKLEKPTTTTQAYNDAEHTYKPITMSRPSQRRTYRKRNHSDDEEKELEERNKSTTELKSKKEHLTNNIDADSDFSIDDSSSEGPSEVEIEKEKVESLPKKPNEILQTPSKTLAINLDTIKNVDNAKAASSTGNKSQENESKPLNDNDNKSPAPTPKLDKKDIWRKRTIGAVFEAAVQRYYARKAARGAA